jgi:Na+/phosphate symporter
MRRKMLKEHKVVLWWIYCIGCIISVTLIIAGCIPGDHQVNTRLVAASLFALVLMLILFEFMEKLADMVDNMSDEEYEEYKRKATLKRYFQVFKRYFR